METCSVRARQLVDGALFGTVLAGLFVGRVEQVELSDQPAVEDSVAEPLPRNAFSGIFTVEEAVVITLVLNDRAQVAFTCSFVAAIGTVGRQITFP